jgi:aminopeptidase N
VRVLEFPRYASFAQSFPNTIPYSEAIGFIARVDDPKDIDYPFYVTAHEVAHQWWAHQLIGADAQGSTLLSETLAQYSALMVMEREYGRSHMRRFLEYELDRYLVGRSTERKREQPLALNENQPYIHYNKGSLAMYALRDYLGEARLNATIAAFNAEHKFKGPPYPTGLDLVAAIKAAAPDSLKYVVEDQLETITLYENKADSALVSKTPDGRWAVDLVVTAKKLRADSLGNETEVPIRGEWIDVGVFVDSAGPGVDRDGVPIYLAKHKITSGRQRIRVVVPRKPARAGIDPLRILIDRQTRDNVVKVQS